MTGVDAVADDRSSAETGASTRERLVASATGLIMQGGYAAAPVVAVAERTGVAAGTLYRHFPSKAALFVEVFRSVCGRELEAMREASERHATATAALDAVVAIFATRALRHPRLAWALLSEPIDPQVDAERLAYRRRYCELVAGIVRAGVASGEFARQDPEVSAAALVGAIGDALVGPLSPAGAGPADDDALVTELAAFCRRAVGVPSAA